MSEGSKHFLSSVTKGVPTKESERVRQAMGLPPRKDIQLESVKNIDLNKFYREGESIGVLDNDVRARMAGGEKIKSILESKSPDEVIRKSEGINVKDYVNQAKGISPEIDKKSDNDNFIHKDEVKTIVNEVLGEILGISTKKLKDEDYLKESLADVINFVKLRESLKR